MLYILIGLQGSTKSTEARRLAAETAGAKIISRDIEGGKVADLIPATTAALLAGTPVILDNTNLTRAIRAPFIAVARAASIPVTAVYMKTTAEDCQIRILRRTYAAHGTIFATAKGPAIPKDDPHVFPPAVLFAARKSLEEPTEEEGFAAIRIVNVPRPSWDPATYTTKAIFLDIDGTIRATEHLPNKYPITPDEVTLLNDKAKMRAILDNYREQGYTLIGVSNQSGIAKGVLTADQARAIFRRTRELLGYTFREFPIMFCPHQSAPISCYCRKPQSGMAVHAAETMHLNLSNCLMVGDMTTDETFAKRLGMRFIRADKFWSAPA